LSGPRHPNRFIKILSTQYSPIIRASDRDASGYLFPYITFLFKYGAMLKKKIRGTEPIPPGEQSKNRGAGFCPSPSGIKKY
jgi:hypothetical protein